MSHAKWRCILPTVSCIRGQNRCIYWHCILFWPGKQIQRQYLILIIAQSLKLCLHVKAIQGSVSFYLIFILLSLTAILSHSCDLDFKSMNYLSDSAHENVRLYYFKQN